MKFRHTNIAARDWQKLAAFYRAVFKCTPASPERDLTGDWLDAGTGLSGARLKGIHLRLPGWGDAGPTLEIFQYDDMLPGDPRVANREGFTHIAFEVEDVEAVTQAVIDHGGSVPGTTIQSRDIPGSGRLTFIYVRDPEGNIVELQSWSNI